MHQLSLRMKTCNMETPYKEATTVQLTPSVYIHSKVGFFHLLVSDYQQFISTLTAHPSFLVSI